MKRPFLELEAGFHKKMSSLEKARVTNQTSFINL